MYKQEGGILKNHSQGFKIAGMLLFGVILIAIVVTIILSIGALSGVLQLILSIISTIFNIASIYLIGNSLVVLSESIPHSRQMAKSTNTWMLVLLVGTIVSSFSDYVLEYLTMIVGLVVLISQIIAFSRLNKTFKQMSQAYPPQEKLDHWIFPLYAYSALIVVALTFVIVFMFAPTITSEADLEEAAIIIAIIISVITVLITIGLGLVLYSNGTKVGRTDPQEIIVPVETQYGYQTTQYQPTQPTQPAKPVYEETEVPARFCSNCGEKVSSDEKFCFSCGSELD